MSKREKIEPKKQPGRNFVIEKKAKNDDEEEIEREIEKELRAKKSSLTRKEEQPVAIGFVMNEGNGRNTYSSQAQQQQVHSSARAEANNLGRAVNANMQHAEEMTLGQAEGVHRTHMEEQNLGQAVSANMNYADNGSQNSSKKVTKKRIIKMMKDGKQIAEKEEILDEDGNVIKSSIRNNEFERDE